MFEKYLLGISPRDYQKNIFESCVAKNCLVVLPTGIGKTLISLMLAIDRLEKFRGKILFLAPTKPLAEQHESYFKKHLPELFADIQLFTGAVNSEKRKKIWKTADIIFSTPQCIANDLRKGLYSLEEVSLLVEDEAHRCIKNYDYNFISQKYSEQGKNIRILGLTASPGSDAAKIKQICKNLFIEKVEIRTRDSDDVKEYLQELEFEKIIVDFPPEFEEIRHVLKKKFQDYVEDLKLKNVLFGPVNKISLIELQKKIFASISRGNKNFTYFQAASSCAQAVKIQHALELLETQTLSSFNKYLKSLFDQASKKQSKGVSKLVATPEFNFAYSSSLELLAKNIEHPKMKALEELILREISSVSSKPKMIVFSQFRDTASLISKRLNSLRGIKSKIFIGQTKKSGEGLSQKEQKNIINEFKEGRINILCATSIGEEGLDIPEVNAVIFYEPVPSAIRAIQRAGRTARLMKGKLIILITKDTRDESFYYASRAREKKMHKAIDLVGKTLLEKKEKKEEQKTL